MDNCINLVVFYVSLLSIHTYIHMQEERKHLFQSRAASDSFFKSISVNEDDVEESLRYRNLLLQLEDINLDDEDYYEDEDEYDDEDYYEDENYEEYEEEDEFDYGGQEKTVPCIIHLDLVVKLIIALFLSFRPRKTCSEKIQCCWCRPIGMSPSSTI